VLHQGSRLAKLDEPVGLVRASNLEPLVRLEPFAIIFGPRNVWELSLELQCGVFDLARGASDAKEADFRSISCCRHVRNRI
jgi:hypothetical protein